MTRYLLIASQDPGLSLATRRVLSRARDLALAGHEVTVYLTGAGVHAAHAADPTTALRAVCDAGVRVSADDAAVRLLGVSPVHEAVVVTELDPLQEATVQGARVAWN